MRLARNYFDLPFLNWNRPENARLCIERAQAALCGGEENYDLYLMRDLPDVPGMAAAVFGPLAENGILVDMIVQNTSLDGHTDITFTISRKDLQQTLAVMKEVAEKTGASEVMHDVSVAKVSAIGVGMRNHSGVAARTFAALTQEGINILMISTSEIKITILIQEKYVELAVRILHDTFGLDWDIG